MIHPARPVGVPAPATETEIYMAVTATGPEFYVVNPGVAAILVIRGDQLSFTFTLPHHAQLLVTRAEVLGELEDQLDDTKGLSATDRPVMRKLIKKLTDQ